MPLFTSNLSAASSPRANWALKRHKQTTIVQIVGRIKTPFAGKSKKDIPNQLLFKRVFGKGPGRGERGGGGREKGKVQGPVERLVNCRGPGAPGGNSEPSLM